MDTMPQVMTMRVIQRRAPNLWSMRLLLHPVVRRPRPRCRGRYAPSCPQIATIFGSPLGGWIIELEGNAGLHGWQWLLLIEGAPTIVFGVSIDHPTHRREYTSITAAQ